MRACQASLFCSASIAQLPSFFSPVVSSQPLSVPFIPSLHFTRLCNPSSEIHLFQPSIPVPLQTTRARPFRFASCRLTQPLQSGQSVVCLSRPSHLCPVTDLFSSPAEASAAPSTFSLPHSICTSMDWSNTYLPSASLCEPR